MRAFGHYAYTDPLVIILNELGALAEGCPNHPAYRAIRAPAKKTNCPRCERLWAAKKKLREMKVFV